MLNTVIIFIFALSWALFCLVYFKQMRSLKKYAFAILVAGGLLTAASVLLDINLWSDTFKDNLNIVLKAIGIFSVLYYIFKLRHQNLEITGIVIPSFVMLLVMISGLMDGYGIKDDNEWIGELFIYTHIVLVMVALLFFGMSCLLAVFYLILEKKLKQKKNLNDVESIPSLLMSKRYVLKFLYLGFLLFTGGLFFGFGSATNPLIGFEHTMRIAVPLLIWIFYSALIIAALLSNRMRQICYMIIPVFFISIAFLFFEIFFLVR